MSEDKKELNENELDKVNGGVCNPDERTDDKIYEPAAKADAFKCR